jgi:hypothetical protein
MLKSLAEDVRETIIAAVAPGGQVSSWKQVIDPYAFGSSVSAHDPRNMETVARIVSGTAEALEQLARRLDEERARDQPGA